MQTSCTIDSSLSRKKVRKFKVDNRTSIKSFYNKVTLVQLNYHVDLSFLEEEERGGLIAEVLNYFVADELRHLERENYVIDAKTIHILQIRYLLETCLRKLHRVILIVINAFFERFMDERQTSHHIIQI